MRRVLILGSTGSIGTQALDVIDACDDLVLCGLACGSRVDEMQRQAALRGVTATACAAGGGGVAFTPDLGDLMDAAEPDIVLNAMVGAAGLQPTLAAIARDVPVALANKETLVAGGEVVAKLRRTHPVEMLPVDSEHSALFQILAGVPRDRVRRLVLTASGGPFRGRTRQELREVGPDDALRHPTWDMGAKITIDSATLMNKGLEVIEAHHLFATAYDDIEVVVHPQSVIHGMVRVDDGSVLAHMGPPDMRVPIGYALRWPIPPPERSALDLLGATLQFMPPDADTFRCLPLAVEAGRVGGTAPAALNAANEVAVAAFLERRIGFLDIPETVEHTLNEIQHGDGTDLEAVLAHDARAREVASARIAAVRA
ncbi:MAG: 1-deoxy-D-xylulose-5-phosphate reductoisomerase [Thermoleophilia bacterium]